MAAPYMISLQADDSFTRFLIDEGWGRSWGVFLRTEMGMKQLRRHCRGLLTARDERGGLMLFRWYDPRVLRAYLPTCRPAELEAVFGPVDEYVMENEDPGELIGFRRDGARLAARPVPLPAAATA